MKIPLIPFAAGLSVFEFLIATPFRALMKNRNKKLGFSPNNSSAKANKTNNYS